jgi:hypothetical protein
MCYTRLIILSVLCSFCLAAQVQADTTFWVKNTTKEKILVIPGMAWSGNFIKCDPQQGYPHIKIDKGQDREIKACNNDGAWPGAVILMYNKKTGTFDIECHSDDAWNTPRVITVSAKNDAACTVAKTV